MAKAVILGVAHPHIFGLASYAQEVPGLELLGVYDPDPQRRKAGAERLKTVELADLHAALKQSDVGLIGAVPSDRAELVVAAAEAGVPVLVDKPLAVTEQALRSVREAAGRTGTAVMVFYPYRGYPQALAAKAALDQGRIGRLVRVMACGPHKLNPDTRPAWHWTARGNGGIFIDIGSHHVNFCCWIADARPINVQASAVNFTQPKHPEFQDFGHAMMRFPDGAVGCVEVDWLNPSSMKNFGDTRFWIQGTTGKIEIRLGDEVSAQIWTTTEQGPLVTEGIPDGHAWSVKLIEDLLHRRPCAVPQDEVWRTSEVTLELQRAAAFR